MVAHETHIAVRQAKLREHPLLARMRRDDPVEWMIAMIPALSFWPLMAQDLLRLVERSMIDPAMALRARIRRRALVGHYFERRGMAGELQYFVRRPSATQLDHDALGASAEAPLDLALSDEESRRITAMIDRVDDAFLTILDAMEQAVRRAQDDHHEHARPHA